MPHGRRDSEMEDEQWRRVLREAFRRRMLREVRSAKAEIARISDAAHLMTARNRMLATARLERVNGNFDRVIARLHALDKRQPP